LYFLPLSFCVHSPQSAEIVAQLLKVVDQDASDNDEEDDEHMDSAQPINLTTEPEVIAHEEKLEDTAIITAHNNSTPLAPTAVEASSHVEAPNQAAQHVFTPPVPTSISPPAAQLGTQSGAETSCQRLPNSKSEALQVLMSSAASQAPQDLTLELCETCGRRFFPGKILQTHIVSCQQKQKEKARLSVLARPSVASVPVPVPAPVPAPVPVPVPAPIASNTPLPFSSFVPQPQQQQPRVAPVQPIAAAVMQGSRLPTFRASNANQHLHQQFNEINSMMASRKSFGPMSPIRTPQMRTSMIPIASPFPCEFKYHSTLQYFI
jgi:hypothetical protein